MEIYVGDQGCIRGGVSEEVYQRRVSKEVYKTRKRRRRRRRRSGSQGDEIQQTHTVVGKKKNMNKQKK